MMKKPGKTRTEWMMGARLQEKAAERAESLLERLDLLSAPVDLARVAASEEPLLILKSGDYRDRFDGQLEYHRRSNRFLLFYNTKYDRIGAHGHHPRTRFSLAHELGHYFLDRHHEYLVRGGTTHASKSEFFSHIEVEREADAFAAGLLMPSRLMAPLVNSGELTLGRIGQLAEGFKASQVSTAIRAVQLSHYPCALAGIRDGVVAWTFLSSALRAAGCYPKERSSQPHEEAVAAWRQMIGGAQDSSEMESTIGHWFRSYDREDLDEVAISESYLPIPSMDTLLVLLAADEDDLAAADED